MATKKKQEDLAKTEEPQKTETATPTRGILLIAAGHPYYGRMAMNLAVSIKSQFPETKIAIAHAGRGISHVERLPEFSSVIDLIVPIPEKCFYNKDQRPEWIKTKLHLPELTPFDETIFLDADMLWLNKNPADVFEELAAEEFVVNNNAFIEIKDGILSRELEGFSAWSNLEEVFKVYQLDNTRYYSIHSEMMYFKKTAAVHDLFATAQEIYMQPKVSSVVFAGAIPDEFALEIAIAQLNIVFPTTPYRPVYWEAVEGKWLDIKGCINSGYYAYSVAGNGYNFHIKKQYDHHAKACYQKAGMHHNLVYLLKQKSDFLPERNLL